MKWTVYNGSSHNKGRRKEISLTLNWKLIPIWLLSKKEVFQCAIQQRVHKHTHSIHCRIPGVLINESQFVKVPLFPPIGWISREYLFMVAFNILKYSFSRLLNECDSFHFSFHALLFVCECISVDWNEN